MINDPEQKNGAGPFEIWEDNLKIKEKLLS